MDINAGTYTLHGVGFSLKGEPVLTFSNPTIKHYIVRMGRLFHASFDTSTRYCIGWRDLKSGEMSTCPQEQIVLEKYEQCPACQKRTGFNPAFYNTQVISPQQEARNQEPHFLYLAYFGPSTLKVGISYAKRGIVRLLEQGARSAVVLDTFPSAIIARQYEAAIAGLPTVVETVQLRKKQQLLSQYIHDPEAAAIELGKLRESIMTRLGVTFASNDILTLDTYYFPLGVPKLATAFDSSAQNKIGGKVLGMAGSFLFCEYNDKLVYLPLKKFIGTRVTISSSGDIDLPVQQLSLL